MLTETKSIYINLAFKPCESVGDLGGNEPCFYLLSIPGVSMHDVLFSLHPMIGWALYQGYDHQKVKISVKVYLRLSDPFQMANMLLQIFKKKFSIKLKFPISKLTILLRFIQVMKYLNR
jgi:hypothetical protein